MRWSVIFTAPAAKATADLPERIQQTLAALAAELELLGPAMHGQGWRHFGKLGKKKDNYHSPEGRTPDVRRMLAGGSVEANRGGLLCRYP